jgi:hypothetical protein
MARDGYSTRQAMTSRPALALSALVAAASGCILFVNDSRSSLGSTCKFQGSDTPCGQCVATQCVSQLDKCCGDSSCEQQLTWLDQCVGNSDDISCQVLGSSAPDLVSCMYSHCGACPGSDAGTAGGSGHPSCTTYSGYCICIMETTSGTGGTCTPQTITPGLCCASSGYPAAGTSCICETFSCNVTSYGADCSLSETPTGTTSYADPNALCCSSGSDCSCNEQIDSCNGFTQVGACTVDTIGCPSGTSVTSCSF